MIRRLKVVFVAGDGVPRDPAGSAGVPGASRGQVCRPRSPGL